MSRLRDLLRRFLGRHKTPEDVTRAIVNAALDCIISMDSNGRIVDFNPAAEKTFGHAREEVLGKDMADLIIPPSLRAAHRRGLAHYLKSGEGPIMGQRVEFQGLRRGGRKFPLELTVTRTDADGGPVFTGFVRDITLRKRAEEEKDRAIQARSDLIAIVSHELMNPLTAIEVSAELILHVLEEGRSDDVLRNVALTIQSSTRRMIRLTRDLLDAENIETGRVRMEWGVHAVSSVVNDAVETLRVAASEKEVRMIKELPERQAAVFGDRDRIIQVLVNLLGNAIKFCPRKCDIRVSGEERGEEFLFLVKDAGPGIPPDQQARIFERYWRGVGGKKGGAGLGLPISKSIVELHGGRIWVESQVGKGSTFYFTLKSASAAARPRAEISRAG